MKELIYEIIDAAAAINSAGTRLLKPLGLTPMTYNILNLLGDEELNQRELSDHLIVVASSVTFQIGQLQRKGLVRRRRPNKRTWLVSLSPKGRRLLRTATSEMDAWIARLQIPNAEATAALLLLRELRLGVRRQLHEAAE